MKQILGFSAIFIMFISIISTAQPRRTPAERAQTLKEQLNLTNEQTSKVEDIYTEADKKIQTAFDEGFDRAKFRAIMDSTNTEISKLLDDKQKETFKKFLEERRNRMRRNRPDNNSN